MSYFGHKIRINKVGTFFRKYSVNSLLLLSFGIFVITFLSAFDNKNIESANKEIKNKFAIDCYKFYESTQVLCNSISTTKSDHSQLKDLFIITKFHYKNIEYLIEYLDPVIAKKINGAPLPVVVVEQDKYQTLKFMKPTFRTFPPEGLQVLEEIIFADTLDERSLLKISSIAYTLQEQALAFINSFNNQSLIEVQIIEACREELIRIMTMGISGFDAPAAGKEMLFCAASLEPVISALKYYDGMSEFAAIALRKIEETQNFLKDNRDFDTFDRLYFIRELADPSYGLLTDLQKEMAGIVESNSKPVNDLAKSIFDKDFLLSSYYAKQDRKKPAKELIKIGRTLFFDPLLSSNNERSCSSCHNPAKAFTDGKTKSIAFDFKGTVLRNSPTLINAIFSNTFFWDSRAQYMQDQIPQVLLKEDELHGTYEDVIFKLNQSNKYRQLFKDAFPELSKKDVINTNTINRSLAAFMQSLVALNSDFDQYMRRESSLLDESAKRGFNLFVGKAGCGTCHFAPIFNGTVPPRYTESESEVLGVPDTSDFTMASLDKDLGKAAFIPAEALRNSFKTPTVRNATITAPYMHNGVFATLEEVMEFYNAGGGAGIGIEVSNQTLPTDSLHLTNEEKNDLIAFIGSLSDNGPSEFQLEKLPLFKRKSIYNQRIVGGSY